jgi:iduronate 2-sulfatase
MQREWVSLPQHFRNNGYYTLSTGKIFHPEEGGSGPAPWDGEGAGMPPLQDPPSWSQAKNEGKLSEITESGVKPGNASMYNVNSLAPMRPCAWDKCSIESNLEGDVQPPVFPFCDRVIGDDAVLKLVTAAANYRSTGQPFFLATGFRKPHLDFRHPSAYDKLYPALKDIKLARYPILNASVPPIAYHETPVGKNPYVPMPDHQAATYRRDYYSAISWTDYNIGRVLKELDSLGLTNDTLVVFHSDHGWSLGEHGQWEKFTNWEHGTRVPLIMRAPWLASSMRSAGRVSEILELIDIFPTMAELAGVSVPESYELDGSSFASIVKSTLSEEISATAEIPTEIHDYALSVYPRCPADLSDPKKYWAKNDCMMKERSLFPFMGLSLRVKNFRYTEWLKWNSTSLSPILDSKPVGIELYDHTGDDGTSFDGPYEVYNLAGVAKYSEIQKQLATKLREIYPKANLF